MALFIRPTDRTIQVIDWDLSDVAHISLAHAVSPLDTSMNMAILRSVAMREGVDSRNHVLAARTLHGTDTSLLKVTPYTVALQKKRRLRWIAWMMDDLDEATMTTHQDGFTVAVAGGAPRGPYFLDAVLVPYVMKDGENRCIPASISTEQAEAILDQPVGSLARTLRKTASIQWVSGVPRQMCTPVEMMQQVVVPVHSSSSGTTSSRSILITSSDQAPAQCQHCGQAFSKLYRCMRCKAAFYCGKTCSTAAWKAGHKQSCVPQQ
jgi:hypothetical protein